MVSRSSSANPVFVRVSGPVPVTAPLKRSPSCVDASVKVAGPLRVMPGNVSAGLVLELLKLLVIEPPGCSTIGPPVMARMPPLQLHEFIVTESSWTPEPRS